VRVSKLFPFALVLSLFWKAFRRVWEIVSLVVVALFCLLTAALLINSGVCVYHEANFDVVGGFLFALLGVLFVSGGLTSLVMRRNKR